MPPSDAGPVVVEQPTTEAEAAAAVEIAEIHADAAVQINADNAEAAVAIAEADAAEDEEWQYVKAVLADLQTSCEMNRAELENARTQIALLQAELIAIREDLTAMAALTGAAVGVAAAAAESSSQTPPESSAEATTEEAAMTDQAAGVAAETAAAASAAEQHAQAQTQHEARRRRYLR